MKFFDTKIFEKYKNEIFLILKYLKNIKMKFFDTKIFEKYKNEIF